MTQQDDIETFFEALERPLACEGPAIHPVSPSAPLTDPNKKRKKLLIEQRAKAFNKWRRLEFDWREKHRIENAAARKPSADRKKAENKQKRTEADGQRQSVNRAAAAAAEGRVVRHRTDCSLMTDAERTAHKKETERNKKRRQRGLAMSSEASDQPYADVPNYGRF
jgi:hypothetical protein